MSILKMAWRNMWRNKRRTGVSIAAMSFALMFLVLYSGLIEGYMRGLEQDMLDLEVGDIQIHAEGYRDKPALHTCIQGDEELLVKLEEAGFPASGRYLAGGLAASGEQGDLSSGVILRGIDVERDAKVTTIQEHLAAGQWLDPVDPKGVVVGRRLAKSLKLSPGSELVIVSQAADGSIANDIFTVRGVLLGISMATDRGAVYMHADTFRELMVFPHGVHQIIVRRPEGVELSSAASTVRGFAGDLDVKTWRELMPSVATMLDSSRSMMVVVFFILYLAVGILLLNAMLMVVFERIREFGVLKALGASPLRIMGLMLAESALQTALALAIGLAASLPGMWYLSEKGIDVGSLGGASVMGLAMRPIWHGVYTLETVAGPVLTLVIIVFVAVLYPALKAAWISPIKAIHHQ